MASSEKNPDKRDGASRKRQTSRRKRRKYQKKPQKKLKMARKHMSSLFDKAKDVMCDDPSLAQRYITLARKVAMKFRLRIPSEYKRLYCKHCYRLMIPGKTARVRVHDHKVIYYCLNCKKFWRRPLD